MLAAFAREMAVTSGGQNGTIRVDKSYFFRKGSIGVQYSLANLENEPVEFRFSTELNLSAGLCAEAIALRLIRGHEESAFSSEKDFMGMDIRALIVENKVAGEKLEVRSERPFFLFHEALFMDAISHGTESRLFQGNRIILAWDCAIRSQEDDSLSLTIELSRL